MNNISKKIIAFITITAILFVMLFSTLYISHHTGHKCTGERCPICTVMEQCVNNIKKIGTVAISVAILFFLCLYVQNKKIYTNPIIAYSSLISQKIRINN